MAAAAYSEFKLRMSQQWKKTCLQDESKHETVTVYKVRCHLFCLQTNLELTTLSQSVLNTCVCQITRC